MDYSADSGWASTDIQSDFKVQPGHSVGEIYGFVSDGRYEVSDFEGFIDGKWVLKAGVADASDIIGEKYLRPGAMKLKNVDGSEDNKVTILSKDGSVINLDKMSKKQVATNIFDMILGKR